MLPLEYLGSLDDSTQVKDYDWGEHILHNVMSEVDAFQKKKANNTLQNDQKKIWVGSCLPVLAIIFMDHLDFPESCLSVHHIDYSLPRASHVSDADFKFVMKHDKNRLTINSHAYGARPFRPLHMTPYANQHAPFGHQPDQPQSRSIIGGELTAPPQTFGPEAVRWRLPANPDCSVVLAGRIKRQLKGRTRRPGLPRRRRCPQRARRSTTCTWRLSPRGKEAQVWGPGRRRRRRSRFRRARAAARPCQKATPRIRGEPPSHILGAGGAPAAETTSAAPSPSPSTNGQQRTSSPRTPANSA